MVLQASLPTGKGFGILRASYIALTDLLLNTWISNRNGSFMGIN
jgi:hypothetical protein